MQNWTEKDDERLKALIWRKISWNGIPNFYEFAKNAITEILVRKVKQGLSLYDISKELGYSVPSISLAISGHIAVKRGRKIDPKNLKSEKRNLKKNKI